MSNSNREITWSPSTNIAGFDWLWCNDQSLGLVNCPKLSKNNHISQGGGEIKATCHNSELPLSGITWSHQLCKSLNCEQARRGRNTKRSHCSDAPRRTNLLIAHTHTHKMWYVYYCNAWLYTSLQRDWLLYVSFCTTLLPSCSQG